MNPTPRCSVCDADQWQIIGKRTYAATAIQTACEYARKRLSVLFEIWFPGEREVTLESKMCTSCGFVTYTPRPTAEDIDRKYRHLVSLGKDSNTPAIDEDSERRRADDLWRMMRGRIRRNPARILDFGGGDGRLMIPFRNHGHACHLLDYNPDVVPGIEPLGATLDDLDESARFDAIICSHVMEHVAEPFEILTRLRGHLNEGGLIYVEVPMEIWRRAPLHEEPVTHVNFFTVDSLWTLMQRAGFANVNVRMRGIVYLPGHKEVAVWGLGYHSAGSTLPVGMSADGTRALLSPTLSMRVRRALMHPGHIPRAALHRVRSARKQRQVAGASHA